MHHFHHQLSDSYKSPLWSCMHHYTKSHFDDKRLSFSDQFPTSFFTKPSSAMQSEYKMNEDDQIERLYILLKSIFTRCYNVAIYAWLSTLRILLHNPLSWHEPVTMRSSGDKDCVHSTKASLFHLELLF